MREVVITKGFLVQKTTSRIRINPIFSLAEHRLGTKLESEE